MKCNYNCQPGSRIIRAFSDVEKPFLLYDLVRKRRLGLAAGKLVLLTRPLREIATSVKNGNTDLTDQYHLKCYVSKIWSHAKLLGLFCFDKSENE